MAAVRRNILTDAASRDDYSRGITLLKAEPTGLTTRDVGALGPRPVDVRPVRRVAPPCDERAHPREQRKSAVWADDCMGGEGDPVTSGPFAQSTGFRLRVAAVSSGALTSVDRPLRRSFDIQTGLPRRGDVRRAMDRSDYDNPGWGASSEGFRNRLEGWIPAETSPHLHNRVHVFVGGDMLPSSSPNDPVFYLNHCNVDRVWSAWLVKNPPPPDGYLPPANASQDLFRHRLDDQLYSIFTASTDTRWTPRKMLDVKNTYSYDDLNVG